MSSPAPPMSDPMPEPPRPPEASSCCGSGCDLCIYDIHDRAVERYREALRAWRERHPEFASALEKDGLSQSN